jgi:hypothetical protein
MVELQARVRVRIKEYPLVDGKPGPAVTRHVQTTVGRALLSEILPKGMGFDLINQDMTKKAISGTINICSAGNTGGASIDYPASVSGTPSTSEFARNGSHSGLHGRPVAGSASCAPSGIRSGGFAQKPSDHHLFVSAWADPAGSCHSRSSRHPRTTRHRIGHP